ncbi:MAG: tadC2 [Collimonas fungivorans]|uniref:type II secretion system F family protein n=1 Tax=Collimonas fungivorans TaxID=158899 RepID=UPI0026EFE10E|nr:type II secretion system F family protein [Collimonas fungivorans]MDB5768924.1 tadC2 [Collimonas fungivorans]
MSSSIYLYGAIILAFGSLSVFMFYLFRLVANVKVTKFRPNMDPLPPLLKKVWNGVMFFDFYFGATVSEARLLKRKQMLNTAGLEYFMTPGETYALQFFSLAIALFFAVLVGLAAFGIDYIVLIIMLVLGLIGWFYPLMWIRDQKKKRNIEISRYFPSFVDIVTLCCECGLTLNTAIVNFCERGPECVLRHEIERVVRDMKTGAGRADALGKFARRTGNIDISRFVGIVLQCDKLGVPLGPTLRKFAEQKRTERFQRAEKLAMEAPMKMIAPLIMFIFPITFIIIAFPIVTTILMNFK